jgi:hypothetical protein
MEVITYYEINDEGMNIGNRLTILPESKPEAKPVFNFFGNTIVSNLKTPLLSPEFKK